jgi:xanthine dehydrogenase YagR molybdenum-binding subunit
MTVRAEEPWGPPLPVVGKPVPRRSARDKVTGRTTYTVDLDLPGMLHGRIARSRVPRGRVTRIDTGRAQEVPGVVLILTPETFPDIPGHNLASVPDARGRPALSADVRFAGQEIAAIAAETEDAAEEALGRLDVAYQTLPAVIEPEEALAEGAPLVTPQGNVFEGAPEIVERGDVARGEAEAEVVLERAYSTESQHHNPLEPHCTIAAWSGGALTLWDSSQGPYAIRDAVARVLGLPPGAVRVVSEHVGGGFGSKAALNPHHVIAAVLAQRTGRPVRIAMSRREEFLASRQRAKTRQTIRGGVRRDGRLTFLHHRIVGQAGTDPLLAPVAADAALSKHLYACPNLHAESVRVFTNTQNPVVFRGPTSAEDLFCFEQFIDELAHQVEMDPLEFRLRNHAETDPLDGLPYSSKGLRRAYQAGAEAFGWSWRPPASTRDGPRRRGIGVGSLVFHGAGFEPSQAWVVLDADGTARVAAGVAEMGCGTETVLAQIAAEELGLTLDQVTVAFGDTRTTPYTINASYGSRTMTVAGPAVRAAAAHAKQQLLALAARELRRPVEAVEAGAVIAGREPVPVREVTKALGRDSILGVGRRHAAPQGVAVFVFGAHFVEVEVDTDAGQVRVLRAVCAHDSGRFLNPLLAESQVQGGFIQGLGMALFEERIMDRRLGLMLNDSMLAYFTPTILDAPASLAALEVPTDDRSTSIGAKGLGEPPLVAAGAAVANAVYNAIGVRVRRYPITPDKVLAALQEARG